MYKDMLEVIAAWAAILTAAVATLAYGRFILGERRRRRALEVFLRERKRSGEYRTDCSVLELMAHLSMTKAEVLHAGFASNRVRSEPLHDEQGRAARLVFEYDAPDVPPPTKF